MQRLKLRQAEGSRGELADILTSTESQKITVAKGSAVLLILKWLGDVVGQFKGQLVFDRGIDSMQGNISGMLEAHHGMLKVARTPVPLVLMNVLYTLVYT